LTLATIRSVVGVLRSWWAPKFANLLKTLNALTNVFFGMLIVAWLGVSVLGTFDMTKTALLFDVVRSALHSRT
jgi:hypothetical protein